MNKSQVIAQLQQQGFESQSNNRVCGENLRILHHQDEPLIDWIEVNSSLISAIAYDAYDATLRIRFRSGAIHGYQNVLVSQFLQFRDAPSKDRFFNHHIKDLYGYTFSS
ncbi:MAG: KTSC domain-containing protein [Pleurocapsa sp. CRU_1_2]|nr:KTSC domain-containing protein [Pleurocapsa sp. CRU_1_2]